MLINLSHQNSIYNQSSKNHTMFGAMPPHRKLSATEKQLTERLRAAMKERNLDSLSKALDKVTKAADTGMKPDRLKEFYIEFRMITRFLKNNLNLSEKGHETCLKKFLNSFKRYGFRVTLERSRALSDIKAKYIEQGGKNAEIKKNLDFLLAKTENKRKSVKKGVKHRDKTKPELPVLTPEEQKIVEENAGLIYSVINKYRDLIGNRDQDFFQEGFFGLIRAIKDYKREIGRFSTYAYNWISFYIRQYLNLDATIVLPRNLSEQSVVLRELKNLLDSGRPYDECVKQITQKHNLSLEKFNKFLRGTDPSDIKLRNIESLVDNRTKLRDVTADEKAVSPITYAMEQERHKMLEDAMSKLSDNERTVICYVTGFNGKKKTMEEISCELGVTRTRVHQLYHRGIKKLRETKDGNNPLRELLD